MIPNKDHYVDKNDKLTDDPSQFAAQIAVAGFFLDDRVAKRYGIGDVLVSVNEPAAVRRVIEENRDKSVAAPKETESEPKAETPEVTAAEPKAKTPKANPAKQAEAKKGAKKK